METQVKAIGTIHYGFGAKTVAFETTEAVDRLVGDFGIKDYAGCNMLALALLSTHYPEYVEKMDEAEKVKWALGGMSREIAVYLNTFMTDENEQVVLEVIEPASDE